MRSIILVALLAFLAIGFVSARPAEDEVSSDVVESGDEESSSDSDATTEAASGDEESNDDEDEDSDSEDADEEDSDADEEASTTAAPKKQIRPFWPKFGGHGPVVIHRRGLPLQKA
ncbi:hypothetical protein KR067_003854 [Drosophila pandora]|nr:hypothetical protein KR067_003854 [Drosophila pandora]